MQPNSASLSIARDERPDMRTLVSLNFAWLQLTAHCCCLFGISHFKNTCIDIHVSNDKIHR